MNTPSQNDSGSTIYPDGGDAGVRSGPPGYEIVRELGRGGMGVVYQARQTSLNREVALKMILVGGHAGEEMRARFLAEAEAIAQVRHESIVQVYDYGTHEGLPYFVMEYCPGGSLAKRLRVLPLPVREAAELVGQLALAVQAAHDVGIVHRDLKPGNVLLAEQGPAKERPDAPLHDSPRCGYFPKITDFGVAKRLERGRLTQTGAILGTPSYMAPEQAEGKKDVGPLADVYALGTILYECLTGQPPFQATTPMETVHRVLSHEPTPVCRLREVVPIDLETICHKCLQKDPAKRYASATALAEDLGRYLADRPIVARRVGRAERLWRWCRREPVVTGLLMAVLVLFAVVAIVSSIGYAWTTTALAGEKWQREHAEQTATLALEALNQTYERFAPTRLIAATRVTSESVEVPPPTLPPEAVGLLQDLLKTYEQLARASRKYPRLRAQAAEANLRIGDIRQRLGHFEEASSAYRTAIDLYVNLLGEEGPEEVRIKLARAYNERGRTLGAIQKTDDRNQMLELAIRTLTEAPRASSSCRRAGTSWRGLTSNWGNGT